VPDLQRLGFEFHPFIHAMQRASLAAKERNFKEPIFCVTVKK